MTNDNGEFGVNPTESETTGTVGNFSHGNRETPATFAASGSGSVGEGVMPYVRHVRYRGVRQPHSTEEAGEQRRRRSRGVGGGKGAGQGERWAIATGPDSEPDSDGFPFVPGRAGCSAYGSAERRPAP